MYKQNEMSKKKEHYLRLRRPNERLRSRESAVEEEEEDPGTMAVVEGVPMRGDAGEAGSRSSSTGAG